jgi:orotate phosphoribosyltransferase
MSAELLPYQTAFIELALHYHALQFGEFTLKSGRLSPYFFNSGLFNSGQALAKLGAYYAHALNHAQIPYDQIFGPAYKGIPLVSSLAVALAELYQIDVPYSFNRKEAKDHGEGGLIVGAPIQGRVLIVDDVLTAGTAVRESVSLIQHQGATVAGILLAVDRQERGQQSAVSAINEIKSWLQVPVVTIICLEDIMTYLEKTPEFATYLPKMRAYKAQYGVATSPA